MAILSDAQLEDARRRMIELFPTRFSHVMWNLEHYARTLQKFDTTFCQREPILDVHLNRGFARKFVAAVEHCAIDLFVRQLRALTRRIVLSDGTTTHIDDIWTIKYMPDDGITIAQFDSADIAEAEVKAGYGGETVHQMIRETYRCASAAEEDWFVRRWIAS
jgi:hypothetical protein